MPGNTKQIKYDVDKKPAPQYFDPELDEYGYMLGSNGASRHMLYGADGQPVSTFGNKLAIRASEIETLLNDIKGKDFATQTTLATLLTQSGFDAKADITLSALRDALAGAGVDAKTLNDLATLIGEVQAAPTANTLLARLKSLEDKVDAIVDGTTPAVTQLSGSKMEVYGASLDDRPDATTVPIGATFTIVDATQEFKSWMSDGVSWGEEI